MSRKLVKHGNSWAIVINKPIMELLKIDENSSLDLSIHNGKLIIEPANLKQMIKEVMQEYDPLLKKLAKT